MHTQRWQQQQQQQHWHRTSSHCGDISLGRSMPPLLSAEIRQTLVRPSTRPDVPPISAASPFLRPARPMVGRDAWPPTLHGASCALDSALLGQALDGRSMTTDTESSRRRPPVRASGRRYTPLQKPRFGPACDLEASSVRPSTVPRGRRMCDKALASSAASRTTRRPRAHTLERRRVMRPAGSLRATKRPHRVTGACVRLMSSLAPRTRRRSFVYSAAGNPSRPPHSHARGVSLPSSLRYRAAAWDRYGAVLTLVMSADGQGSRTHRAGGRSLREPLDEAVEARELQARVHLGRRLDRACRVLGGAHEGVESLPDDRAPFSSLLTCHGTWISPPVFTRGEGNAKVACARPQARLPDAPPS
ncbi:hypothetical protein PYCCODRAFT_1432088 [Trametes coccinea BRFM310]|uniref:Uncharacterized protein n=1 Tax=Trametes coccinea (strain BRFM310) TaxID=1353009 RepID=A0A1Y2IWN5_TRAC3|nr:hypothetical protein PYCCODRAFT_1432088 [Trametes coccinea BRFM310]